MTRVECKVSVSPQLRVDSAPCINSCRTMVLDMLPKENGKLKKKEDSRNRVISSSLNTGGSVPSHEHAKKLSKDIGKRPMLSQLYLATQKKKKDNQWLDEKAKTAYVMDRRNLVAATSGPVAEEHKEDIPKDLADATQQNDVPDEELVQIEASLPVDGMTEAWVKAVGGTKTGKVCGLGPYSATIVRNLRDESNLNSTPLTTPPPPEVPPTIEALIGTPASEEAVGRAVEQRMASAVSEMRLLIQDIFTDIRSLSEKNLAPSTQHDSSSLSSNHPNDS